MPEVIVATYYVLWAELGGYYARGFEFSCHEDISFATKFSSMIAAERQQAPSEYIKKVTVVYNVEDA